MTETTFCPMILAPAGERDSFLAALSAGADAIYCGVKSFSARMQAQNFNVEELAALTSLAHEKNAAVYLTLNSMIRESEIVGMDRWLANILQKIKPDALIIQDLSFISLARSQGFKGEIHLSTLANVSFFEALRWIQMRMDVDRVVLPRELSIDEIKSMANACSKKLNLEVFVHGALCYAVSGRCYWSSFLGGKSGLRGECVQPCRRIYNYKGHKKRYFSCADLCLDVLVKTLLKIPQVRAWKIEGRKKGPHYVYHTTLAYKIMRDHGNVPEQKKEALALLEYALGRQGTHYHFLPQRQYHPISTEKDTGSGYKIAKVSGKKSNRFFSPREPLFPGDRLRIGYEDQKGHHVQKMNQSIPKGGKWVFQKKSEITLPEIGSPVFLIDRKDPSLMKKIQSLHDQLPLIKNEQSSAFQPGNKQMISMRPGGIYRNTLDISVFRQIHGGNHRRQFGIWLSRKNAENISKRFMANIWWWLPPVIWPEHESQWEKRISDVWQLGARRFVVNAPWQAGFFNVSKCQLWAGPFCNVSNTYEIKLLASKGFSGVIISPELTKKDILLIPEKIKLPLGIVLSGFWPLCISRIPPSEIRPKQLFMSPKGEISWYRNFDDHLHWIFPNWRIDLNAFKHLLIKAGYYMFIDLKEPVPKSVDIKIRPGLWNWE
jgi:putative protease